MELTHANRNGNSNDGAHIVSLNHKEKTAELLELNLLAGDEYSVITDEAIEKIKSMEYIGLCMKKFKADIVVSGLDLKHAGIRSTFSIGAAVLQISGEKRCHSGCILLESNSESGCPLKTGSAFMKVIKPGKLSAGSKITGVSSI